MKKEKQTGRRSITTDLEKDNVTLRDEGKKPIHSVRYPFVKMSE